MVPHLRDMEVTFARNFARTIHGACIMQQLRFRLMVKRGPCVRPQASEGEAAWARFQLHFLSSGPPSLLCFCLSGSRYRVADHIGGRFSPLGRLGIKKGDRATVRGIYKLAYLHAEIASSHRVPRQVVILHRRLLAIVRDDEVADRREVLGGIVGEVGIKRWRQPAT